MPHQVGRPWPIRKTQRLALILRSDLADSHPREKEPGQMPDLATVVGPAEEKPEWAAER